MLKLDRVSVKRLSSVEPRLADVVRLAQARLAFPVRVTCGLRTKAEQEILLKTGKTRTMRSKHLAQSDGFSHAVDLVAMIDGEPDWSSERFFVIADHVRSAAIDVGVSITWGGIWHPPLNTIKGPLAEFRNGYVDRFVKQNKRKPFFDAPHFQL